ncbi:hypothetical protein CAL7716_085860 [Calothrix sp. PCC 7716]|nr:hypothetical protein CAL7716_085860 [Calothrix sp. PCC 7716]
MAQFLGNQSETPVSPPVAESNDSSSTWGSSEAPRFVRTEKAVPAAEKSEGSEGFLAAGSPAIGSSIYRDVSLGNIDSIVSAESLIARTDLQMSDTDAAKQLYTINRVTNGLNVQLAKGKMVETAIKVKTQEVKNSTAMANYSTAVSENKDAWDKAEHSEFKFQRNKSIRGHERRHLVSKEARFKAKADTSDASGGFPRGNEEVFDVTAETA